VTKLILAILMKLTNKYYLYTCFLVVLHRVGCW